MKFGSLMLPDFIPVVHDNTPETCLGILEIRVRFSNRMEFTQSDEDIELLNNLCEQMMQSHQGEYEDSPQHRAGKIGKA